ncbi:hypothetical protein QR78_14340 [Methylobacterium indicum]|uniref:Uncharacterized protein n=1 Tax=Methylobacterium indicum TaxID=1775910 RepID=A0ABR5HER7_9HYPH|nr:hypothetical protein QR78_14340 [Methylobacterium indicum]KMO25047.1 hypothetical protein QR79_09730 [Methylobacterium indicum]
MVFVLAGGRGLGLGLLVRPVSDGLEFDAGHQRPLRAERRRARRSSTRRAASGSASCVPHIAFAMSTVSLPASQCFATRRRTSRS